MLKHPPMTVPTFHVMMSKFLHLHRHQNQDHDRNCELTEGEEVKEEESVGGGVELKWV
jgi:hypothetical protein